MEEKQENQQPMTKKLDRLFSASLNLKSVDVTEWLMLILRLESIDGAAD